MIPEYRRYRTILLLLLGAAIQLSLKGQEAVPLQDTAECVQKDLKEVVREALHRPVTKKKQKSGSLLLVPIIGFTGPAHEIQFRPDTSAGFIQTVRGPDGRDRVRI